MTFEKKEKKRSHDHKRDRLKIGNGYKSFPNYYNCEETMNKQLLLSKYSKPEDKLLISKMIDKIKISEEKNKIEYLDFLDLREQHLLQKIINTERIENFLLSGAIDDAERKILLFYPDKLRNLVEENEKVVLPIKCIRIKLPKEMYGKYNHRNYLGGLVKLGIKREKIGDILVFEDGADIIILDEIEKFLLSNLGTLTRFNKADIEVISLNEIREKKINKQEINIIVPSLRIDAVISDILKTSRGKVEELIKEGKVFLNYEQIYKSTKQIKENDILVVRGKGKFEIASFDGTTRNGRMKVKVYKFV